MLFCIAHLSGSFEMKSSAFAAFAASTTSSLVAPIETCIIIKESHMPNFNCGLLKNTWPGQSDIVKMVALLNKTGSCETKLIFCLQYCKLISCRSYPSIKICEVGFLSVIQIFSRVAKSTTLAIPFRISDYRCAGATE